MTDGFFAECPAVFFRPNVDRDKGPQAGHRSKPSLQDATDFMGGFLRQLLQRSPNLAGYILKRREITATDGKKPIVRAVSMFANANG